MKTLLFGIVFKYLKKIQGGEIWVVFGKIKKFKIIKMLD
jgi:hypothetical protein